MTTFPRDDRPVYFIPTHPLPRNSDNPTGIREDLVDSIEGRQWLFHELLGSPFNRAFLHMPAGWRDKKVKGRGENDPSVKMGAAQRSMEEPYRDMYDGAIQDVLRARNDQTVGIYGGHKASTPWSIDMENPVWHYADVNNRADRWLMHQCIDPWVNVGVKEYCFDHAAGSDEREGAIAWAEYFADKYGLRIIIEAIPNDWGRRGRVLDYNTLDRIPSMALSTFMDLRDPDQKWDVKGMQCESIIWVNESLPSEKLTRWLERGFVLGASRYWREVQEAYRQFDGREFP